MALRGPLDDVRRRLLLHGAGLRDPRRRLFAGSHRRDRGARLRPLRGVRHARLVPRVAHRSDPCAADTVDLRERRLRDRVVVRPDRPARLGRLPGRPAREPVARLLRLGPRRGDRDHPRRGDDLQQPVRLHGHQRVRALPRDADPDPVVHLPRAEGIHHGQRQPRRHPRREHAVLGRRRSGDRLLDVGQRARLLALRQTAVQLAAADVHLRRGLVRPVHDGRSSCSRWAAG